MVKAKSSEYVKNEFVNDIELGSLEDYAYGCILGAYTGDACGSYNEFCKFI